MKHAFVRISLLTNWSECKDAVEAIENDPSNYEGGHKRWFMGVDMVLLAGAKSKIEAIWKKAESFGEEEYY